MRIRLIIGLLFFSFFSFDSSSQEINCFEGVGVSSEIDFLFEGTAPIIRASNDCEERFGLEKDMVKDPMSVDQGVEQSLKENALVCLKAFFKGLKESASDLMSSLWSLAKSFAKTLSTTTWEVMKFLKAAFTGNLSYWFAEISQDANNFANAFIDSVKAIPGAVAGFFGDKLDEWDCLNDKGQVNFSCHVAGYLGADILAAVATGGYSKLAIASRIKHVSSKFLKVKKAERNRPSARSKRLKLSEVIPAHKRDSRFIVEADEKGHFSVRYFDNDGNPKMFDGSPFYHLINRTHRKNGVGTHRDRFKPVISAGEHFSVDVDPEKFQQLLTYIEKKKGSIAVACTRTACESMKAAGVDLGQKKVPSIDGLYKGLLSEAKKEGGAVSKASKDLGPEGEAALIEKYAKGTNLVKLQFGMTAMVGVIYTPAIATAPLQFTITQMQEYRIDP